MKPQDEKNIKHLEAMGYNLTPIELVHWDKETGLVTLRAPVETISNTMDILGTIAATWGLQDETAVGHPYERIDNLSDQFMEVLKKAKYD